MINNAHIFAHVRATQIMIYDFPTPNITEILRSVTKAFEDKAIKCVPPSVEVFSNSSRMELLISSGGMQIAYHSMLTFSGSKAMERLPGINNLSSTQLFFLVTAQELCSKSAYEGVETDHKDFHDMWVYQCQPSWLFVWILISICHFPRQQIALVDSAGRQGGSTFWMSYGIGVS